MSTVQPKSEQLKKAIKWISEKRKENPDINLTKLVDQAGFQFDLSPKDSQFLLRLVRDDDSQNSA
ncbi:hypothetical protein [Desulfobacula toluolica]|uniref:Conserved uncharacterized protein n=1 Tax=Desulfobacula toluolica (strain DSM 7467 / Tol2) TaxID=651182 RepID=K0NRI7_DESTT|nr:hypothetical protein [Desulfobacula toluolica]CCK81547.1 conserved uncharacterized protein [Desulfobacula toluolica Tol2]